MWHIFYNFTVTFKGRPRKNRIDHSYEKPNENRKGWEIKREGGQNQGTPEPGNTSFAENKNQSSTTGNADVNIRN